MADNIPFEIQVEIIKRLPVKSLIQFRSVSKTWKHLIDSSDFIAHYSGQQQHLLIRYDDVVCEEKYVSLIDDDTFPQHKLSHTLPQLVNMPKLSSIIGSSHGLLCFYGVIRENCGGYGSVQTSLVVVWNISIRKVVGVVVPKDGDGTFTSLGFGVCRETSDVKILKITHTESMSDVTWQVDVFTLKTRAWRSSYGNLPRKTINFSVSKVVIDGVLYWLAIESSDNRYLIISFDMTSEEFREVSLPDNIAYGFSDINSGTDLFLSKLSESLIVLERIVEANSYIFGVWMMKDGVSKLFTKLYTVNVNTPHASLNFVRGFRKTGEPIIEFFENHDSLSLRPHASLATYEPHSKSVDSIGINGRGFSFFTHPYMETLLLLDQPNSVIYDK